MKPVLRLAVILLIVCLVILGLAFFAPLPVPYYQDFSVMYFTDRGLANGIPIYAYPEQLKLVRSLTPEGFSFLPYPYPPWFALTTFFIGLLPIQAAARVWFLLNLGMLGLSTWLLTSGWQFVRRMLGMLASVMFLPAFGLLVVGQYSAPVLLGAALLVYATRQKAFVWAALGLLLLTFKPHIGGFLFLAGLVWLAAGQTPFARRALWLSLTGGLLLAGLGFLADPAWPLSYLQSLGRYQTIPGVQTCDLCASLPVGLLHLLTGQSSTLAAAGLSLALALVLGLVLRGRFRGLFKDPDLFFSMTAVLTLLLDPYLLNYDYILLLLPLFWLAPRTRLVWLVYLIPWAALSLGRGGNVFYSLAGLLTFILLLYFSDLPSNRSLAAGQTPAGRF